MESEKVSYYSYSAADNNEIKRIREKYAPTESKNIKLEQLRALDKSVHTVASTFSIAAGVIGLLIFGFALTCVLEWSEKFFALGVASGLVGLILIISANSIYKKVAQKKKEQITPEIIKLTDELLK